MHRGPVAGFLVAEVSATLAVPLGYGVAGGPCGPPGIFCYARGVACATVCTDAWSQFPAAAAVGAGVGLAPAFLVALLLLGLEHQAHGRTPVFGSLAIPALGILGTCGTLLIVALVFPYMGGYGLALVTGFGLVLSTALGVGDLVAGRFLARQASARGP